MQKGPEKDYPRPSLPSHLIGTGSSRSLHNGRGCSVSGIFQIIQIKNALWRNQDLARKKIEQYLSPRDTRKKVYHKVSKLLAWGWGGGGGGGEVIDHVTRSVKSQYFSPNHAKCALPLCNQVVLLTSHDS